MVRVTIDAHRELVATVDRFHNVMAAHAKRLDEKLCREAGPVSLSDAVAGLLTSVGDLYREIATASVRYDALQHSTETTLLLQVRDRPGRDSPHGSHWPQPARPFRLRHAGLDRAA